jgi:UDP-GlcNAc:undecaprenyl-phosphate GlcNAc-1-phosphate transferase
LIYCLAGLADRIGWVDHPNDRKRHPHPIPVVGGVGIFIAFLSSAWFWLDFSQGYIGLLVAMLVMAATGLVDDLAGLPPGARFIMQALAASVVIVISGLRIAQLGDLFALGPVDLGIAVVPFTVFCLVGVVNAFNMSDGVDGLAGFLGLNTLMWLVALTLLTQRPEHTLALVLLAAAITGFLFFNFPHPWRVRATVFMGDAGSMTLGIALAWFLVALSQGDHPVFAPMVAPWIFAIPLMDTVSVMIRRAWMGANPFCADCHHLHHLIQQLGYSPAQTTVYLLMAAFLLGGIGVGGWYLEVPDYVLCYGFIGLFLVYLYLINIVWSRVCAERSYKSIEELRQNI